ncbi:MAG TPA: ABC transporter ATP-binding protein [Thermodesulfobacteriota bacterium]|nr:ABC transporter ATP-binding protein [Thermodesulfobacteriota bacterium]
MLLEIREINTFYGESHILQGISLNVDSGETVSILGRNGVGKTTTLKSIIGLLIPRSGSILFDGREISGLPPYEIANIGIGYVPEDRRIFPKLTVRENLLIGIKPGQKREKEGWTVEKFYDYFPNLKDRDKQKGAYLSGGEQQMLTIARSLMGNPGILLLDEPTEGLAPKIVARLEEVIQDIHQHGVAILLVEQNMQVVLRLATRLYVMSKGTIVFDGTAQELEKGHGIRQKYLEV